MGRPNVVLICVDQWRGDCLGVAGHPVVETPYLNQMAQSGARFERAYSATPTCIPARAALYTGLTQRSHGRVGYADGKPWEYPVTMGSVFTENGYQTQAIGKFHVYPERSQMGFQNVQLHDGFLHYARRRNRPVERYDDYLPWLREKTGNPEADYFDHGVNCNSQVVRPWDKAEELHPTNWIVTQAIRFLARRDEQKPFFLYLGFHRPHPPYDPPAWAFEMYRDVKMPEPAVGDWADEVVLPHEQPFDPAPLVGRLTKRQRDLACAGYYGHMTHIDHQLNRFLEVLAEFGVKQETYVCFTSDHGEMLGDHHGYRKSVPFEGSARVPFLLTGAGIRPQTVVGAEAVMELRDVLPTLLDCAGLPIPDSIEGKSVLPFAKGEATGTLRPYLHGEHTVLGQSVQYVTDGREKYVWWSGTGREQLFDLVNDPQELHDRVGDTAAGERLAYFRSCLVDELRGREEGFVDASGVLMAGQAVRPLLEEARGMYGGGASVSVAAPFDF